jgi:hypothetical protein
MQRDTDTLRAVIKAIYPTIMVVTALLLVAWGVGVSLNL